MGYLDGGYVGAGYITGDEAPPPPPEPEPFADEGAELPLRLELNYEDAGDPPVWVDESAYLRRVNSMRRGRENEFDEYEFGELDVLIGNETGRFNTDNDQSPLFTRLVPERGGRLSADVGIDPAPFVMKRSVMRGGDVYRGRKVWFPLFTGLSGGFPQSWETSDAIAEVSLKFVDGLFYLGGKKVGIELSGNSTTGQLIVEVLIDAQWPGIPAGSLAPLHTDTVDIDLGIRLGGGPALDTNTLQVLQKLARTSGGEFFVSASGKATFRDGTSTRVAPGVWGDRPGEFRYEDLRTDPSDVHLINEVTVTADGQAGEESVTVTVPTSQKRFLPASKEFHVYPLTLPELTLRAEAIAQRYAIPRERITGMRPVANGNRQVLRAIVRSELGDPVPVRRRPRDGSLIEREGRLEQIQLSAGELEVDFDWDLSEGTGSPNLLTDEQADFEGGTTEGWLPELNATLAALGHVPGTKSPAFSGFWMMAIEPIADGDLSAVTTPIAITANVEYFAGGHVARDREAASTTARLEIDWQDAAHVTIATAAGEDIALAGAAHGGVFKFVPVSAVAPLGAAFAVLRVFVPDAELDAVRGHDGYLVDAVSLARS